MAKFSGLIFSIFKLVLNLFVILLFTITLLFLLPYQITDVSCFKNYFQASGKYGYNDFPVPVNKLLNYKNYGLSFAKLSSIVSESQPGTSSEGADSMKNYDSVPVLTINQQTSTTTITPDTNSNVTVEKNKDIFKKARDLDRPVIRRAAMYFILWFTKIYAKILTKKTTDGIIMMLKKKFVYKGLFGKTYKINVKRMLLTLLYDVAALITDVNIANQFNEERRGIIDSLRMYIGGNIKIYEKKFNKENYPLLYLKNNEKHSSVIIQNLENSIQKMKKELIAAANDEKLKIEAINRISISFFDQFLFLPYALETKVSNLIQNVCSDKQLQKYDIINSLMLSYLTELENFTSSPLKDYLKVVAFSEKAYNRLQIIIEKAQTLKKFFNECSSEVISQQLVLQWNKFSSYIKNAKIIIIEKLFTKHNAINEVKMLLETATFEINDMEINPSKRKVLVMMEGSTRTNEDYIEYLIFDKYNELSPILRTINIFYRINEIIKNLRVKFRKITQKNRKSITTPHAEEGIDNSTKINYEITNNINYSGKTLVNFYNTLDVLSNIISNWDTIDQSEVQSIIQSIEKIDAVLQKLKLDKKDYEKQDVELILSYLKDRETLSHSYCDNTEKVLNEVTVESPDTVTNLFINEKSNNFIFVPLVSRSCPVTRLLINLSTANFVEKIAKHIYKAVKSALNKRHELNDLFNLCSFGSLMVIGWQYYQGILGRESISTDPDAGHMLHGALKDMMKATKINSKIKNKCLKRLHLTGSLGSEARKSNIKNLISYSFNGAIANIIFVPPTSNVAEDEFFNWIRHMVTYKKKKAVPTVLGLCMLVKINAVYSNCFYEDPNSPYLIPQLFRGHQIFSDATIPLTKALKRVSSNIKNRNTIVGKITEGCDAVLFNSQNEELINNLFRILSNEELFNKILNLKSDSNESNTKYFVTQKNTT